MTIDEWQRVHSDPALVEGWAIFECDGSAYGRWQVQRIDHVSDCRPVEGVVPRQLAFDDDAWKIVMQGNQPHHIAARAFIRENNPTHWDEMLLARVAA